MANRTDPGASAQKDDEVAARPGRVPLLCAAWAIGGLIAVALSAAGAGASWPRLWLAGILTAAAVTLQVAPVRLSHDGQSEYLALDEAFLVPMAVYLSTPEVAAGVGLAALVGNLWHRRGWMRTAFNSGQVAASASVGAVVAGWLGAGTGLFTARAGLAAVVGVLVYSVMSMLAVAGIVKVAQGTPVSATLRDGVGVRLATWGSALSLGVLISAAIESHAWVLVTAVVPIAMLQFAYRRAFRQYRERRQMERLYEATTAIRATVDSHAVRQELIRAAYELLPARTARLVEPEAAGRDAGGLRVSLDETTDIEVTPTDGSDFGDEDRFMLQALTSVAATALANARFQERLAHQAFHDPVTDLPNRALFLDRLHHAQARMARVASTHYALVFIDLDRFKVVNDSLGHAAGDALLVQVSGRLQSVLRTGDTLARFGGDEFVVLLEDLDSEDEASIVVERLLASLAEPFLLGERELIVTASAGVVVGDGTHLGPDECVREADVAMYRAKARGGGCFEVFRHDPEGVGLPRLDLEIDLRRAVSEGELELHYQPVVRTDDQTVVGVEALVRWRHPVRGLVSPAEFIPLAEETGLILPLGQFVLEEACRQIGEWRRAHPELHGLVVSVNLSPRQFRQADLDRQVAGALERSGLDPASLCLEVTEGVMVDDVEAATCTLNRLRALGVAISVDDFGTGYSSLSYLKRFPIDYVKIDRSFVAGLDEKVDSEIVRSVIRLAAAIGIDVVAEGVENDDQLSRLAALGCPLVQGYHLARPQPPAETEAFIVASLHRRGTEQRPPAAIGS